MAFRLHYMKTYFWGEIEKMRTTKNSGNEVILNLVSHKLVTWTFVKLCMAYRYVGLLV